ncbi:ComEA family DNA-binding protein [Lacibacter sp. H407]|uniref:ComEA family DNA-binding protein n=1 Tax=Lacibacter sp. H407 TaxID=3133423 RepID=UPI0030BB0BAE
MKEYFSFTKKERNAVLLLGTLAALFALLPTMFPFLVKDEIELVVDTALQNEIAALQVVNESSDRRTASYSDADLYQPKQSRFEKFRNEQSNAVLFAFDPNTASEAEWQRLGLRDKTIQTILNYRSKGGKFFKAEDLQRIYGLRSGDYERLKPYVQIASQRKEQTSGFAAATEPKIERKEYAAVAVDINTADTAEWKRLKGIGSGYARRIVNFRSKLGGFVSVEQVKETFGLPDSVYQQIKPQLRFDASSVQQIDLNKASIDELKAHPYIAYAVANAIVQYRKEHGDFTDVDDIRKIGAIDAPLFNKIAPYLRVR